MSKNKKENKMQEIVSLCKRRGFIFQSSEIYGGLRNVYDYGPLGVELLNNIKALWWDFFVTKRQNVVGINSQILMHPKVWEASGHVKGFSDPLIECKSCHSRLRADHIIGDILFDIDTDSYDNAGLEDIIKENKINCPVCNEFNWDSIKDFNLMFKTTLGSTSNEDENTLYLRPETAQGMFVLFNNVLDSTRLKVPFGIAQIGKAFRNEITKGKFIFRTLEFTQMELQFFIKESMWEDAFYDWRKNIEAWYTDVLGITKDSFVWKPHSKLAHYAKAAEDYMYKFSWGFDEVSGLHYRTDFDLQNHEQHSGQKIKYRDPQTQEEFTPHDIESTFGLERNLFMILDHYYSTENDRVVLKLPYDLAPYKMAVFPLVKNKPEIVNKAKEVFDFFVKNGLNVSWDDRGNIGKRYLSQDEIGTPKCITIDYQTLEDGTVTVRDRDTTEQVRVKVGDIV